MLVRSLNFISRCPIAKQYQEQGTANPSFAYSLLKKYDENVEKGIPNHFTMQDIQGASGSVFIAGSNTVSSLSFKETLQS